MGINQEKIDSICCKVGMNINNGIYKNSPRGNKEELKYYLSEVRIILEKIIKTYQMPKNNATTTKSKEKSTHKQ